MVMTLEGQDKRKKITLESQEETPTGLAKFDEEPIDPIAAPAPVAPLGQPSPLPAPPQDELLGGLTPGTGQQIAPTEFEGRDPLEDAVFGEITLKTRIDALVRQGLSPKEAVERLEQEKEARKPSAAQITSAVARPALHAVGLVGGGIAGAAGGPLGVASIPFGTFLGFSVADQFADRLDQALGVRKGPESVRDVVSDAADSLKEGAELVLLTELGVAGAKSLAKEFLAPLTEGAFIGGVESLRSIMNDARALGIKLTPSEITLSKGIGRIEAVLDMIPWTTGVLQKFRLNQLKKLVEKRNQMLLTEGQEEAMEEVGMKIRQQVEDFVGRETALTEQNLSSVKNRMLEKLGSTETNHELGASTKELVKRKQEILTVKKNKLYDNVEDLMPDSFTGVPTNTIAAANKIKADIELARPKLRDKELLDKISDMTTKVDAGIEQVRSTLAKGSQAEAEFMSQFPKEAKQGELTFGNLVADKKSLGALRAKEVDPVTKEVTKRGQAYGKLIHAIKKDMAAMTEATGNKTVMDALDIANAANVELKNFTKNKTIKAIMKANPEAIVGTIFKEGNETMINEVRKEFGEKTFTLLKKKFTSSMFRLNNEAPVTGKYIRSQIEKYGETLNSIYSKREIKNMRDIANVIDGEASFSAELISNPLLRSIVSQNRMSSTIIDAIVKPNDISGIETVRRVLGEPGMQAVRRGFLGKFLAKNQDGNFSPVKFSDNFNKYGRRVLDRLYPPAVVDDLARLARVSSRLQAADKFTSSKMTTGTSIITFGIGTMAIKMPLTALTIIVSAFGASKIYLGGTTRKLMMDGLRMPLVATGATELAAKLMAVGMKANLEDAEDRKAENKN